MTALIGVVGLIVVLGMGIWFGWKLAAADQRVGRLVEACGRDTEVFNEADRGEAL